jgi:hypothetical protein
MAAHRRQPATPSWLQSCGSARSAMSAAPTSCDRVPVSRLRVDLLIGYKVTLEPAARPLAITCQDPAPPRCARVLPPALLIIHFRISRCPYRSVESRIVTRCDLEAPASTPLGSCRYKLV